MENSNNVRTHSTGREVSPYKAMWNGADVKLAIIEILLIISFSVEFFLWGLKASLCFLWCGGPWLMILAAILVPVAAVYLIVALIAKWSRLSKSQIVIRLALLAILLSGALFYLCGQPSLLPILGMRWNVARTGGIEQLHSWAIDILQRPDDEVLIDPHDEHWGHVKQEILSEQVKTISTYVTIQLKPLKPQERYVLARVGGGGFIEMSWGIILGPPGMKIEQREGLLVRWRPGVYAYVGR